MTRPNSGPILAQISTEQGEPSLLPADVALALASLEAAVQARPELHLLAVVLMPTSGGRPGAAFEGAVIRQDNPGAWPYMDAVLDQYRSRDPDPLAGSGE